MSSEDEWFAFVPQKGHDPSLSRELINRRQRIHSGGEQLGKTKVGKSRLKS